MADSKIQNPVKAIRAYCLECAGSAKDVEECNPTFGCQLWEFRMGKNPYRTPKNFTEEQKQALIQRGKKLAEMKRKTKQDV